MKETEYNIKKQTQKQTKSNQDASNISSHLQLQYHQLEFTGHNANG